jgi:hypothetical protein
MAFFSRLSTLTLERTASSIAEGEPIAFPLTLSPRCLDVHGDHYAEISFGDIIAEAPGGTVADSEVCNLDDARGVALGWVLSKRSKHAMSCLVVKNAEISELAAELAEFR